MTIVKYSQQKNGNMINKYFPMSDKQAKIVS
jgi:hypothetical protein